MADSKDNNATELSADDLDMAVGGASVEKVTVARKEENNKFVKGEQNRKYDVSPREEMIKRE